MQKGDTVEFGRPNGEKTIGKIVKVNQKTFMVEQLESRGTYDQHAVGQKWRVAKSLCRPFTGGMPPVDTKLTPINLSKRSDDEIMSDINDVYCDLSPENLSCDGELGYSATSQKYSMLQGRLNKLFSELGRKVSESEAWEWFNKRRR